MSDNLFLIDLRIKPCAYVQEVIEGSFKKLVEGTEDSGGKHVNSFKISGENRIISIINGNPEGATLLQSKAYGELSEINCTMLRPYESFAEKTLNVSKSLTDILTKEKSQTLLNKENTGNTYWMVVTWEHQGISHSDMLKIIAEQANFSLGLRKKEELIFDLYKSVGSNQTHSIIKRSNGESLDNIILNFPIVKKLGSQVKMHLKQVYLLQS